MKIIEATWITETTQDTDIPEVMEALNVIECIYVMKADLISLLNPDIEGAQAIGTMKVSPYCLCTLYVGI